jgi:hypothetical protein
VKLTSAGKTPIVDALYVSLLQKLTIANL